jgi:hypothetical protein
MNGCGKSRPLPPGFHPRTFQPVAFRAHNELNKSTQNDIQRDVRNRNFVGWFVLVPNIILYFEGKKQIPTASKQKNSNTDMFARNNDETAWVYERSLAGIVDSNLAGA